MISPELEKYFLLHNLNSEDYFFLRVKFGIACIERVEHLLTNSAVIQTLSVGKSFASDACSRSGLNNAALKAAELAKSHPGSGSIDGSGSAAVTTSFGVAAALAGRSLEAAGYAAYASVYSYASHAVTDATSYKSEHDWQIHKFNLLIEEYK